MSTYLKASLATLFVGVLVFTYLRWRASYRPPVRFPQPLSRKPDESYQATNAIAKLLLEVLSLRDRKARWPEILKTLNPDDSPSLRTVLLELRWLHVNSPDTALQLIERVCIKAKRPGEEPTRLELLEIANSLAEVAHQQKV